ncbi:hypothetical protein BH23PLA1_BH23PLA1_20270 [soil metagenome]
MSANTSTDRPTFGDRALQKQIARLRRVDNATNLGYLALEYLSLAAVIGGAIVFVESRGGWGLPWIWNVPIMTLAILLVGGLQHRLAGLGHEAAHYTLLRNKTLNDLVGDWLCMFPIFGTLHFYRLSHLAHHQFTNHPGRDPNVLNTGDGKGIDNFPMPRGKFILTQYLRPIVAPRSFLRYLFDYARMNGLGLGMGQNVYVRQFAKQPGQAMGRRPRLALGLGISYLVGFIGLQWVLTTMDRSLWLIPAGVIGLVVATGVAALLPDRAYFQSPFRQPYSDRVAGVCRLAFFTAILVVLGLLRTATSGQSTTYFFLLWVVPGMTSFNLFLMLRDVYQHANADEGRLTNTRIFYCDPLTRWAVLMYGQDMHLPHHLFPAVPHYRLGLLHRILKHSHPGYAKQAVECHGTFFHNREKAPTILDTMAEPRTTS